MARIDNIIQKRLIEHLEKKLDIITDRIEKLEKIVMELKYDISEIKKKKSK